MSRGIRGALCLAALLIVIGSCSAQVSSAPGPSNSDETATAQGAATASQPDVTTAPVAKTPQGAQPPATEDKSGEGLYVFKAEVQEVVLHASVIDEHHKQVMNLARDAFQVFDDGKPQRIESFRQEDIPVAMGIVIDNSGSMRDKRAAVNDAALNLVKASNPQDQVCVVNFNNDAYLDQDYTGDVKLLKAALEHIESRGGTALYDALVATSDHLIKSAKLQKKVILVVTDGEDNASHDSLQQAVRALAVDGGPAIYSIGVLGHEKGKRARHALKVLSLQTGGLAYFPSDLSQVDAISQQIAHEIRNQYTIGYRPTTPMQPGAYHSVVVKAAAKGYKGLMVRTRSGYFVPESEQPKSPLRVGRATR